MTTDSRGRRKIIHWIVCVIVTAVILSATLVGLFIPIWKCKLKHDVNTTDELRNASSINESEADLDFEISPQCNVDVHMDSNDVTLHHHGNDTVVTYSICDAHKTMCLPLCIVAMFVFIAVTCTATCKSLEQCCTALFNGRYAFLKFLGFSYALDKKLDRHPFAVKINESSDTALIWNFLARLVQSTWIYDDQLGRDALHLSHRSLDIKHIYAIHNDDLRSKYDLSLKESVTTSTPTSTVVPDILTSLEEREKPMYSFVQNEDGTSYSLCSDTKNAKHNRDTQNQENCDIAHLKRLSNNELFLFHGTKIENVLNILKSGFSLKKAKPGALYGPGLYLTDSSQKADQYGDSRKSRRSDNLAMIVVRTVVGKIGMYKTCNDLSKAFDTVVAGQGKRFHEFIKYDSTQCYPAFVIIYERSLEPAAINTL